MLKKIEEKKCNANLRADTLINSAYRYELKSTEYLYEGLEIADMAHVAMLFKTGIIEKETGVSILRHLLDLQMKSISELKLIPARGDVYTNREHYLKKKLGGLSNFIHTGRARREATNIAFLISSRENISYLGLSLISLCKIFLKLIERHKKSFMTDFTYLQHAHPTTLAHYLLGYLYPLIRDLNRLQETYMEINQSPAGSGSVNGSSLPLDRAYLMKLLGFDGMINHTRDAMWRHDVIIEAAFPMLTILTTLSRFSEELIIWCTSEFGFLELSSSYSRKSVIMPQKKNPYSLAYIRGLSRSIIGRFISIANTGQTTSGQPDNRIFAYHDLPNCIDETRRAVDLMAQVLNFAKFDKKQLLKSANKGFTIATDVTDYLVTHYNIDNRSAYRIVDKVLEEDICESNDKILEKIFERVNSLPKVKCKAIKYDEFMNNFKVENLLEERRGVGGANMCSVETMIVECNNTVTKMLKFFNKKNPKKFRKRFDRTIRKLIENSYKC